ncbi:hypothetical protein MNBD_BACTEROID06-893, partial [hydrothermal vent metagenome]
MANKSIIKQYIDSRSSSAIRSRANRIALNKLILDETKNQARSEVIGSNGDLYDVVIKNYNSSSIISSCNCPYDWNGLCKHEVAVLKQIDAQKNKCIPNQKNVLSKKYSKTAPYIIKPFKVIDDDTIASHSKHYNYYINFDLDTIKLEEDTIILQLPNNDHYWENNWVEVKVAYKDNSLILTCECNATNQSLCKHQHYALLVISNEISPYYFDKKYKEEQWSKALKQYGYSLKDNYYEYFTSAYVDGDFVITPKVKGLMPLLEENKWQTFSESLLRKSSVEDYLHSKIKNKTTSNLILAVGISFYNSPNKIPVQTKLLTGKPNKSGLLSSRI